MQLLVLSVLIAACAAASFPFAQQPYRPPYQPQPYYPDPYQVRARAGLERNAAILRSDADVNEAGYQFAFETENGIQAQESGVENNGIQAQGSYSYTGDDGQVYSVSYTAGANGFEARGAHIPTPPPIPEAIARALAQNAADEARGIFDDGSYHEGKYASGVVVARSQFPSGPYRRPYTPQANYF